MTASTFGVSRVWVGEISDPPQYLSLLAQRIATLGGSYRNKYEMIFETVRQNDRHKSFFANNKTKIKQKNIKYKQEKEEKKKEKEDEISITSKLLSSNDESHIISIVPYGCLSTLKHSKHNQSVFVMFENHIISASNLLTTQFIDPFKLNKRNKTIYVNGECYKWCDFYIYFGQISLHTSPADFVIVEIEYQCLHSLNIGNSDKILQETFHWIITPISRIIISSNIRTKTIQTELEKSMDVDDNKNNNYNNNNDENEDENDNENENERKDVFVELSNEKGEKIKWISLENVDFSKLDIDPRCNFDGRHLSALYCRAFSAVPQ